MRKILVLLVFTVSLLSCSRNAVKLVSYSPNDVVPGLTSFTFEFSKDLAPPEQIDRWTRETYITFSPKIPGQFKWTTPSTLIFSPDRPLEPSQDYKAEVTRKVLFNNKQLSIDVDPVSFHTAYFAVDNVDFFWTQIPHSDYRVSVQANIHFNYPVNPAQLQQYLDVYNGDTRLNSYQVVTHEPSDIIAVNFGEVQQTDKEQHFTLKIKKGLNSIYKKRGLNEDHEFTSKLAPLTKLAIQYVTTGFDGGTGWIEVGTSQKVDEDQLAKYISLDPKQKVTYTVNPENFRINGSFQAGDKLHLKIANGLPGLFGGKLEFDYEDDILLADLDPSIRFTDGEQHYLMLGGRKNVSVEAVNIPEAEINVYKVYSNNLLHFLNNNSSNYYEEEYDEEYYDNGGDEVSVGDYGKLLYSDTVKFSSRENLRQRFNINLNKALGQRYKGIYAIQVNSSADYWMRDALYLAVSDLGIIAKKNDDELLVWVNSIATTQPVSGVKLKLISSNNQVLAEATTGADGLARFSKLEASVQDFEPRLLTAEKDEDFNYLDLKSAFIETSRFAVDGKPAPPAGYDAFVYSERNLYRPGETMHVSAILRNEQIQAVKDMPVVLKMISPEGKVFQQWKKTTNAEGSLEQEFAIPQYARTGQYVAEVYSGTDQLIGSMSYNVEDFAPDKIKVELKSDKKTLKPGEEVAVDINAMYLFGAPAANHKYEMDINFSHTPYQSEKFRDFDFSNYSYDNTQLENGYAEGTLDADGNAKETYKLPADITSGGVVHANALISVFDVTGRTVSRGLSYTVYPKDYFIGIRNRGYYYGTNEDIPFRFIALNTNDQPLKGFQATVELVRYDWQTVLRKNYSDKYYYASERKEVPVWSKDVTLNAATDYKIRVPVDGEYEVRVSKKGEQAYIKSSFYAYGYNSNMASSFPVNREGNIEIVAGKPKFKVGETAKILFMTPFSGRMLVTIERDKVYKYMYLDVKNNSAELSLPIEDAYMPNVYISATLFKKHSARQSGPFLVGHGYASIAVEKPENKIPVQIVAPQKIKPRTTQTITIKTIPQENVYVTLAAVDEGILQIKGYQTPDPYGFEYAKRQLNLSSYDLYKFLLPEIVGTAVSTGADAAFEMTRKRSIPLTAQRFRLLSYWSGIRRSDASGNVKVSVNIPQFNGQVRFMAVAYAGPKFGSAEAFTQVSDDIILMPAVPRFLSQNDKADVPVTVMNTTDRTMSVKVALKASGPVQLNTSSEQSITLGPKEQKQVGFTVSTGQAIGVAKLAFQANGSSGSVEDMEIAVRPNSPLVKENGSGVIKAGQTVNIEEPANYLPGTRNMQLSIAAFPALQHARYLRELIGYPYGCIEQTVAKSFPQLYFDQLAALAAPDAFRGGNPVYFVKEGIRKIESMQLYDGSMAYWPGGTYNNWWGSVFAAHFLIEAKKAGYEVNQDKLNYLLSWLSSKASEKGTYEYVTYDNGRKRTIRPVAYKETIYTLYVLALAKKGDMALMNYYRARPNLLSRDMQYMLAGAYALMNNWSLYHSVLPGGFVPENTERETGFNFDSDIRANALMLNVLLEVEPSNPQIPVITRYLVSQADRIYSTQDMCWAFMALGKAAKANASANVNVTVNVNGKPVATYTGKPLSLPNNKLNGNITLSGNGNGQVYYFWSAEGIKLNVPVKEEDQDLKVRRTYYDRNGREIKDMNFAQGQLVVCKISLQSANKRIDNIAITDMIPAGFEIMNPRLGNTNQLSWLPANAMQPDNMDVRDDRLILFTDISPNGKQDFYYMLRAVNTGTYQLPAIGAEAMYNPDYHSYHGAATVKISPARDSGI